jgi:SpoVK/Ycf46/Vps4 family AAA+-type ATPase
MISKHLYQEMFIKKVLEDLTQPDATPVLCYGPPSVGKTFMCKSLIKEALERRYHYYVEYVDCNALSSQIQSVDAIDTALEYILVKYAEAVKKHPSVVIFDNLNAICPMISSEEQSNIIDQLKSLKFTSLITKLAER